MRIIVTGGAGLIGSHLCDSLIENGHDVICIDNFISSSEENIKHLKENTHFTFLKHNVIQPLSEDIEADWIYHLASPASPNHHSPISYHALPVETMEVNTIGTHNLLKHAKLHNARFVFSSTSEVYGDPLEHPQKETYHGNVSTTGPRSIYDESKRFGETLVSYYNREHNIDTRIARIFNTYGPRMSMQDMRMSVQFVIQALKNEPITIYGDGSQTRSLCYVDDLVQGLTKLMEIENISGEIINIGTTYEHTVKEYAELIKKLSNSKSTITLSEPLPNDDPSKRQPDISKAKQILNWEPQISLEEGLLKTITYFKEKLNT